MASSTGHQPLQCVKLHSCDTAMCGYGHSHEENAAKHLIRDTEPSALNAESSASRMHKGLEMAFLRSWSALTLSSDWENT